MANEYKVKVDGCTFLQLKLEFKTNRTTWWRWGWTKCAVDWMQYVQVTRFKQWCHGKIKLDEPLNSLIIQELTHEEELVLQCKLWCVLETWNLLTDEGIEICSQTFYMHFLSAQYWHGAQKMVTSWCSFSQVLIQQINEVFLTVSLSPKHKKIFFEISVSHDLKAKEVNNKKKIPGSFKISEGKDKHLICCYWP